MSSTGRRSRGLAPARLAAGLWLALAGVGCGGSEQGSTARPRVLIVGIDGASPLIVEPLIAEGRLPNLARMAREGAYGRLRSFLPFYSPRVWTTVATGKRPEAHGIEAFVRTDATGGRHLYLSGDRRSHALWNIVSDAGMRVGVVNWWTTHPPERVDGVIVTDHLFPEVREQRAAFLRASMDDETLPVHPASWLERIQVQTGAEGRLTDVPDPFVDPDVFPGWVDHEFLSTRFHFDETVARMALEVEEGLHPELLMVLLPGVDKISHLIWGAREDDELLPPGMRFPAHLKEGIVEALYRTYEQADALVGLLSAGFGPDDLVIVLSDHGFHVGAAMARLTGLHKDKRAQEAVLFARGRGIAPGSKLDGMTVRDVTPTVLAWLGLPVGLDMAGRPPAFLDLPPPATIATHDVTPIERVGAAAPEVERSLVEELESLGYLEEQPPPKKPAGAADTP